MAAGRLRNARAAGMTYLLDSDTCITYLRARGNHSISNRLSAVPVGELALPCIVVSEILYGGFRAADPTTLARAQGFCRRFAWLPFDEAATELHAKLRADLSSR